jgi:hypothetical protein
MARRPLEGSYTRRLVPRVTASGGVGYEVDAVGVAPATEATNTRDIANVERRQAPRSRSPQGINRWRWDEADAARMDHNLPSLPVDVVMATRT